MKKIALFFIIYQFSFLGLHSQIKTLTFTLEECIEYAKRNSTSAKIAKSEYQSRKYFYQAFKSQLYPQISFSGSLPGLERAINAVTQPDGSVLYLQQSQLSSTANLQLSQQIPFTGGRFSLSSGISRIDIFGTNNVFFWRSTPVQLSFWQPLFQINELQWNIEIQELQILNSDRQYVEAMEEISINTTQKFFNLYLAQMNVENAKFNVAVNDTLYQLSLGRYSVGKIAENDLLQSELGLINVQNQLENYLLEYEKAKEELKIAIGLDDVVEFKILPPLEIPQFKVEPELAIEQAKKNRSDLINFKIEEIYAEKTIAKAKSDNSFQANISASFGLNQSATAVPDAFKNLLDQERFNISLEIPLFQWGKAEADIESAKSAKEKTINSIELRKKQFELEVKYQALNFSQYQKQVAISAKADTIATRRFEVARKRYLIGKIDMNTYFIAQNEKDSTLRSYIQTLKNFWVAFYQLRRSTLYDFVNNKPLILEK